MIDARQGEVDDLMIHLLPELMWFISDTCNTLLKLCVKLNSRISATVGRAFARFHSSVNITFKCIIFTCIVGTATLNTVGLHLGVYHRLR